MDKKKLKEIEKKLMEKKQILLQEATGRERKREYSKSEVKDFGDSASEAYEDELLHGISEHERQMLQKVENALKRISEGSYGKCYRCRKDISKGRLKAMPWALYCIECKEAMEKEGAAV